MDDRTREGLRSTATEALRRAIAEGRAGDAHAFLDLCLRLADVPAVVVPGDEDAKRADPRYRAWADATTTVPPEETKPPARAHLKGCILDTDHKEGCYVPCGAEPKQPEPTVFVGTRTPEGEPWNGRYVKASTLSPRQALGEALACVGRARSLVEGIPLSTPNRHHALSEVDRARAEVYALYESAK